MENNADTSEEQNKDLGLLNVLGLGQYIDYVKMAASIVGLGGVSQDRFFKRYFEIKDIFKNAGYPVSGTVHDNFLTQFKIRKTQVKDKKSKGNYAPEFARLHAWVVAMLNYYNNGLGTIWAQQYPSFEMANLGNIWSEPIKGLAILVKAFPPNTYNPSSSAFPTMPQPHSSSGGTVTTDSPTVTKEGNVIVTRDANGNIINTKDPTKLSAGFVFDSSTFQWVLVGVGMLILVTIFLRK